MPRLIHLNGPSRVGKSTLARRYAEQHPGTLVVDLDELAGAVEAWQEDFFGALEVARARGRELAARHLRSGGDVVLPQLVTVHDRGVDPTMEATARAAGAAYVEVALLVDDTEHRTRLLAKRPATEVEARVQALLEDPASDLVERVGGHLREHLAGRPAALRLDTTGLDEHQAYARLLDLLAPS